MAKQQTLIDIVKLLNMRGHRVQYRKRNDGSIRITKIDGTSFTGSAGNIQARAMVGATLSESRTRQLETIRTEKGQWGHKRSAPLPETVEKKIRRVQRKWRKNKVQREGYVGRRNIRYTLEHYGEEEALRVLNEQERYASGIAYTEVINWIISRIDDNIIPKAPAEDIPYLEEFKSIIRQKSATLSESAIAPIHELLYGYEHHLQGQRGEGTYSAQDIVNKLNSIN